MTCRAARFLQLGRERRDQLVVERVDLVERDDHRLVGQARAIVLELVADDAVAGRDILVIGVDQVEQHAAALDMAEEAVADPGAFGRALDQAGDVGDDELAALVADDAELRAGGGEGIGADLGLRVGDGVDEGRLAGVGQPDQAGVGEQLEPQPDPGFLARPAGAVLARRAVGRGLVAGVAAPAVAAAQEDDRAGRPWSGRRAGCAPRRRRGSGCRPAP